MHPHFGRIIIVKQPFESFLYTDLLYPQIQLWVGRHTVCGGTFFGKKIIIARSPLSCILFFNIILCRQNMKLFEEQPFSSLSDPVLSCNDHYMSSG